MRIEWWHYILFGLIGLGWGLPFVWLMGELSRNDRNDR